MITIAIACPECSTLSKLLVGALLLEVATDEDDEQRGGTATWICPTCSLLVDRAVGWADFVSLVAAGVSLVEEPVDDDLVPNPEHAPDGPPLTLDDLLDLHARLDRTDWFAELGEGSAAVDVG